ncbi:GTP-binding protein Obg/CgtA [Meira miltonrushii]|uniref:GTP-binding protein Obg/CgtA n=1 Tax=Meira miltonrushii TaxID=1280837 RepID=A0A316V557_9BASI|nr:GTP-binding protein Obg/CgtA [Meira miltonrushii]PWN32592.1 GTP-binding protein Obg/CgtA [Meira miltonrushii]
MQKNPTHADSLQIRVKGGQGGDGCVAFAREKFNPYGPPSGSDGGNGGGIAIQADPSMQSLARIPGQFIGDRGEHGSGDWQAGKQGMDKIIYVPIGTVVQIVPTEVAEEHNRKQYEALLKRKFRSAYMRKRRVKMPQVQDVDGEDFTPEQLREQRDSEVEEEEADDEYEDLTKREKKQQKFIDIDEVADSESDIRALGRSFREAERRLAFRLLDADVAQQEIGDTDVISFDITQEMDTPKTIVAGGKGGLGNAYFASSAKNRSPTLATRGSSGEEAIVHLEWKFKGDVGLIGLPNAGKSTFLKSVCATGDNVRIANYAFTTLTPNVGVVRLGEQSLLGIDEGPIVETQEETDVTQKKPVRSRFGSDETSRFILQDLPGLVEGASDNRGLGHDFLKHIERCLALYYVVDVSSTAEAPWDDVRLVFDELEKYREGLSEKVQGIVANKCDALDVDGGDGEARTKLLKLREEVNTIHGRPVPVWNVSAKHRMGVERVARAMDKAVKAQREKSKAQSNVF